MIPELGHFALSLSLGVAILLTILPLVGTAYGISSWTAIAKPAARWQFYLIALSYACLTYAFITGDFSVKYVWATSHSELPLIYRISGVWGGHEGSLLLWLLMLSFWGFAVSVFSRSVPQEVVARVLSVIGFVTIGFILFTLITSNPFERIPFQPDGQDLNPLLQDPGLAIHPPMLYMGYVGFSVAFAFAIAAMLGGRLDTAWARWARPWTVLAWVFLTIGIALGSWWAYYELGWGGWWFWDPVENASFMPWLAGTALIHSLAATEKRGVFKSWTVFLAVIAFSLSLLGTFLVRSGVLVSVHAFASDPERGTFILVFLGIVVGLSLILYSIRAPELESSADFQDFSKETMLVVNNILFVLATLIVLGGTLYPIIAKAFGWGSYSVGPPYFDLMFSIFMLPMLALLGFGYLVRWKKDEPDRLLSLIAKPAVVAVMAGVIWTVFMGRAESIGSTLAVGLGMVLGVWVSLSALFGLWQQVKNKRGKPAALFGISRSYWGMTVAHFGVGMFTIGVVLVSSYSIEKDIAIKPGETYQLEDYEMRFVGVDETPGPNYTAQRGTVEVWRDGELFTTLHPEKRVYRVQTMPMTEAAIDAGFTRDLYAALGEPLGAEAWALRLYWKPYIRWIWLGCLLMGIGGLISISDRRYRIGKKLFDQQAASAPNAVAPSAGVHASPARA